MKRLLLLIQLIWFTPAVIYCQTFTFAYNGTNIPPPCNVFKIEPASFSFPWKVSHGSPSSGDLYGQNTFLEGRLSASFPFQEDEKSDGLFIAFDFVVGHVYDIKISVAQASGDPVGIDVFAANGIVESTNTTCNQEAIPTVSDKQAILSEPFVYSGPTGNFGLETVSNWIPTKNYSQLWFMAREGTYEESGSLFIDQIFIVDKTNPVSGAPDPPSNLHTTQVTSTSFKLQWTAPPINYRGFFLYIDNVLTTWDGSDPTYTATVSGLTSCSSHQVVIYSISSDGKSVSVPSTLTVLTLTKNPTLVSLSTDLSSNQSITYTASSYIEISPGFAYNAVALKSGMHLVIQNCSTNPSGRISLPPINLNLPTQISHSVYHKDEVFKASLYPNPVDNEFKASIPSDISFDVTISNVSGQILKKLHNQNRESIINVASLPQGLYIVEIQTGKDRFSAKMIKK